MLDVLKLMLARDNTPTNLSHEDEEYVPFDDDTFDPGYVPSADEPGDFGEVGDIPSAEVEGK